MSSSGHEELCFVAMPFGTKRNHETGIDVQFDEVYKQIIKPAVEASGLQCIRADEEQVGGIIHKPMYERLLLCDYAVADLSTANANVYYEVGIRHAFRPYTTVLTFAQGFRIPFDLGPLRGLPYQLDKAGKPENPTADANALTESLRAAQNAQQTDSPLFQLLHGLKEPDRSSLDADAFRARVDRNERFKRRIKAADSKEAVHALRAELPADLKDVAPGVLVDLLIAYRHREMYGDMIKLVEAMPEVVAKTPGVREQYALALNRSGNPEEAKFVIDQLQEEHGPTAESWGLLGRIYKDRWKQSAGRLGGSIAAQAWLDEAISAYTKGFQTDLRAHYPGINAVHLMWIRNRDDPRWQELLAVVRYSAMLAAQSAKPHYWDFATMMETAIYRQDMDDAVFWLTKAVTAQPTPMEASSTLETIERLRRIIDPEQSDAHWDKIANTLRDATQ